MNDPAVCVVMQSFGAEGLGQFNCIKCILDLWRILWFREFIHVWANEREIEILIRILFVYIGRNWRQWKSNGTVKLMNWRRL